MPQHQYHYPICFWENEKTEYDRYFVTLRFLCIYWQVFVQNRFF